MNEIQGKLKNSKKSNKEVASVFTILERDPRIQCHSSLFKKRDDTLIINETTSLFPSPDDNTKDPAYVSYRKENKQLISGIQRILLTHYPESLSLTEFSTCFNDLTQKNLKRELNNSGLGSPSAFLSTLDFIEITNIDGMEYYKLKIGSENSSSNNNTNPTIHNDNNKKSVETLHIKETKSTSDDNTKELSLNENTEVLLNVLQMIFELYYPERITADIISTNFHELTGKGLKKELRNCGIDGNIPKFLNSLDFVEVTFRHSVGYYRRKDDTPVDNSSSNLNINPSIIFNPIPDHLKIKIPNEQYSNDQTVIVGKSILRVLSSVYPKSIPIEMLESEYLKLVGSNLKNDIEKFTPNAGDNIVLEFLMSLSIVEIIMIRGSYNYKYKPDVTKN